MFRAIEGSDTLRGIYELRDPRFVTQAKDLPSHIGYQHWHRELDREVREWIGERPDVTPAEFESFLRERYQQPDLRERFPRGFESNP